MPLPKTMYGARWPLWWVRMRGRQRLHFNVCPWCYSSPPNNFCPVCEGDYDYGPKLTKAKRHLWAYKFYMCLGGMPGEFKQYGRTNGH